MNLKEIAEVAYKQLKAVTPYQSGNVYRRLILTGKSYMQPIPKGTRRFLEYICKCGKIGWARMDGIISSHTGSCGCLHTDIITKHGLSYTRLNKIWDGMIRRCYDSTSKHYKSYGGRGVTVCDEWRNDVSKFYNWAIENGYEDNLELDKDKLSPFQVGIIYSPEYCCFLTHKENSLHTSRSRMVQYRGEIKNLSEWCKELRLDYSLMRQRIGRDKWDATRAFETQAR